MIGMKWNIFRKEKPKEHSITTANLMILQSLQEIAKLGNILEGLFNNNDMETKEIKIVPPEGYEIDKENSTFECVKFKPIKKDLTYEYVVKELFDGNDNYYINAISKVKKASVLRTHSGANNFTSKKQAEKLLAINKLMNVAKYLNGKDWKPNWSKGGEEKWYLKFDEHRIVYSGSVEYTCFCNVFFKSEEDAQQAIDILGEETIRLALSTDW